MRIAKLLGSMTLAILAANPAGAGSLSPGDSYSYEVTTGGGQVLRPTVTFISQYEQSDNNGQIVRRDRAGNRVIDKDWTFSPHNGEFPDSGALEPGRRWTTDMEVWREGEPRIRQSRSCEVTERGNVGAAGLIFPGAMKVECTWSLPGEAPFRNDVTWYWADDEGYNILLLAEQEGAGIGRFEVRLTGIESDTFDTSR